MHAHFIGVTIWFMDTPFRLLGVELKALRQRLSESLLEVSGAIEIDINRLERIESGIERPSEDILMLLISHFGMQDDEAVDLWQLAGYDRLNKKESIDEDLKQRSVVLMMTLDTRILYSDYVNLTAGKNGIVLDFSQNNIEFGNPSFPVARIGMSYDQARELMLVLHQSILNRSDSAHVKRISTSKSSAKSLGNKKFKRSSGKNQ